MPATIIIDGKPFPANVLGEGQLACWEDFITAQARAAHNPFRAFAEHIKVLPESLQHTALREFMASDDFRTIPPETMLETLSTPLVIEALCFLVTGQQGLVTRENAQDVYAQLVPFIRQEERTEISVTGRSQLAHITALREKAGRPPLSLGPRQASHSDDLSASLQAASEQPQQQADATGG